MKSRNKGGSLLEPLVAIAVLSFGMLGLAKFQLTMLVQSSDSRARVEATALASELLAQVRVDPANAGCYASTPPAGSCGFAGALEEARKWREKAVSKLPSNATIQSSVLSELNSPAANQFRVVLTWANKGSDVAHSFEAITDVRP